MSKDSVAQFAAAAVLGCTAVSMVRCGDKDINPNFIAAIERNPNGTATAFVVGLRDPLKLSESELLQLDAFLKPPETEALKPDAAEGTAEPAVDDAEGGNRRKKTASKKKKAESDGEGDPPAE